MSSTSPFGVRLPSFATAFGVAMLAVLLAPDARFADEVPSAVAALVLLIAVAASDTALAGSGRVEARLAGSASGASLGFFAHQASSFPALETGADRIVGTAGLFAVVLATRRLSRRRHSA